MSDNPKINLWLKLSKILSALISSSVFNKKQPNVTINKTAVSKNTTEEITHAKDEKIIEQNTKQPDPSISLSPAFIKGQPNKSDSPNSIEVRKVLNDEFGGGRQAWDLQCTEYTQFRINQVLNIKIDWPKDRTLSRHGRNWAKILENRYNISPTPKVDCAMSFTHPAFNNPFGHVAFVEEVLTDGSVRISEANWPGDGIYNERIVKKDDLETKYQARFIDFKLPL